MNSKSIKDGLLVANGGLSVQVRLVTLTHVVSFRRKLPALNICLAATLCRIIEIMFHCHLPLAILENYVFVIYDPG